jgi:hypothetical protein
MNIKNKFPGYFTPTEDEFKTLWNEGVFIFDTNILLHFYRYNEETYKEYTEKIFKNEKIKDRIWIPNKVFEEFLNNKDTVFDERNHIIKNVKELWKNNSDKFLGSIRGYIAVNPKQLVQAINSSFESEIKKIELLITKNSNRDADSILAFIEEFTQDKIGNPLDLQELKEVYTEGKLRYELKRPPGYEDMKKKEENEKYGDLVIWKQILKEVRKNKSSPNFKYIIFVIDDVKSDWWLIENGKIKSPRPELVDEIKQAGASLFYMYNLEGFLKYAKQYLNIEFSKDSEEEIKDISEFAQMNNNSVKIYTSYFNYGESWGTLLEPNQEDSSLEPNQED